MRQGVVAAHRHTPVHRQRHDKEIRRVIYTTNAIESLNSVIRKATKNRRVFPTDRSRHESCLSGHRAGRPEVDGTGERLETGYPLKISWRTSTRMQFRFALFPEHLRQ